jgi:hypothetical protein
MAKESTWTPEKAKALDATLSQPHMQDFLIELKARIAVKGIVGALDPGYDALVLSALAYNAASGRARVLELIEEMRSSTNPVLPLKDEEMFKAPKHQSPQR